MTQPTTVTRWSEGSVRDGVSPITVGALAVAATGVVAAFDPTTRHIPTCPLRWAFDIDCPFCGGLRSVWSLTRGRIGDALDFNLLVTVAVPFLMAGWVWWLVRWRRYDRRLIVPGWVQVTALAVLIAFMVVRNIPAFGWLNSAT